MGKIKDWLAKTGFSNLAYIAIFIFFLVKGFKNFNLWIFLAGAALGLFVYLNLSVIKKLIK